MVKMKFTFCKFQPYLITFIETSLFRRPFLRTICVKNVPQKDNFNLFNFVYYNFFLRKIFLDVNTSVN